jgi:hypothetical protein
MSCLTRVFASAVSLLTFCTSCGQTRSTKDAPVRTYVASTPCNNSSQPLSETPISADCEFIKWNLQLFPGKGKQDAGAYQLNASYGISKPSTQDFMHENKLELKGTWKLEKRRISDRFREVYVLDKKTAGKQIILVRLSDDILHLLDSDNHFMIGNASWSYTFNRVDNPQTQ